jgi:hypothetical protein
MARYDRDMPDGGGDLGFYTGLEQEGEKGTTIAEQNAADAAARAAQSAPELTRAQQVTAARLASSPIAQEAARTTEALKKFTAKGGLLGVPGSNIQGATAGTSATAAAAAASNAASSAAASGKVINSTYVDPTTGDIIAVYSDGTNGVLSKGTKQLEADLAAKTKAATDQAARQSAYDLLYSEFNKYGLGSLVDPLKNLITSGASPAEFTIKLRESDAYKKRFAANQARIQKGLKAISEAEYLGLEDQYQNIMRNYGLPAEYYARGDMGTQEGFNKFIANDVSAAELEDRVMTAQNRVMNANPEVLASLKAFYPDINNGDILAYTLDPTKGLDSIKRKVTAAEIGGAATQAGLQTGVTRAEQLGAAGITKAQAQQGFGTIAGGLQRGSQLASIYGENPYTQTTAEQEVFGLAGKTEAEKQRKKLTSLETAAFGGQSGVTSGALARDRAGAY